RARRCSTRSWRCSTTCGARWRRRNAPPSPPCDLPSTSRGGEVDHSALGRNRDARPEERLLRGLMAGETAAQRVTISLREARRISGLDRSLHGCQQRAVEAVENRAQVELPGARPAHGSDAYGPAQV